MARPRLAVTLFLVVMRVFGPIVTFVLAAFAGVTASADQSNDRAADQAAVEAAQYDTYRQPAKIVASLSLRPGMRVADVGAGRGFFTTRLAGAVGARGHVVAVDVDAAALAAIPPSPIVETRRTAADDPQLESHRYNRILVAEVDHLLPDRVAYLRKLAQALTPDGFIAVCNRMLYRRPLLAAAEAAGLRATEVPLGLPAQFFIRLEPKIVGK
jgi:predicted methyltransferase